MRTRRSLSVLMAVFLLLLSMVTVAAADKAYTVADVTENRADIKVEGNYLTLAKAQGYFGISGVDMTGVKAIAIVGQSNMKSSNGEVFRIKLDDPNAEAIGFVSFDRFADSDTTYTGTVKETSGVHTLYFVGTYIKENCVNKIREIRLLTEAPEKRTAVPDSAIVDNYHDTWACVDDYGRKVADYEEAGPVKEGDHVVGIFYTNWNTGLKYNVVIPDVYRQYPESKTDFYHPAWGGTKVQNCYWGEPVLGFYSSYDYWVYRRHAQLLANAGIDAVFPDNTNGTNMFVEPLRIMMEAFSDYKKEGGNPPKVSMYGVMGNNGNAFDEMMAAYYNVICDEKYEALWFRWNDRYFASSFKLLDVNQTLINTKDKDLVNTENTIDELFEYRSNGSRKTGPSAPYAEEMLWLENYPMHHWGIARPDGRVEIITIGTGINESYVDKGASTGVFSDPYAKGRAYSEAFGEDYSADNGRKPYFFREQSALALEIDPAFVFVDGWNEWNTVRYGDYGSYKTAFVDLCDEEGSRDFEPSRSYLKDDYYNLLTDFVRKYKGVRPAPLASAPVTIDINSDAAQWDSVAPEFIADGGSYERDNDGGAKDLATDRVLHYTTKVYNAFSRAKVARDGSNYYFYVKTENDIVKGTPGWMNLFINSDRNPATGWNGYDICVNRLGEGVIASFNGTTWESVGTAAISVSGNVLQMAIPKSFFGDIADIEFKWTDGFVTDDYLDFYTEGSVAPLGRFNYLYTEVAQKALTANERAALKNTTIVKAGSNKMIIDGGKVGVYEKDTRVTAFEMNGTVYVPYMTYEDILGYGYAKVEYDAEQDILHMSRHDLSEDLSAITNKEWTYTFVGSLEVRKNGRVGTLSAPVIVANGILYVPLTYVAETFGWQYQNLGGGIYAIGRTGLDASLINSIANAYLN